MYVTRLAFSCCVRSYLDTKLGIVCPPPQLGIVCPPPQLGIVCSPPPTNCLTSFVILLLLLFCLSADTHTPGAHTVGA